MSDAREQAYLEARQRLLRLQEAYSRVFDKGRSSADDRQLVIQDLESVCNARRSHLRESEHATIYEMGKFAVWQRIANMRFPRPADVPAEPIFQKIVPRDGAAHDEQQRPAAGRGVAEPTED